MVVIYKILQDSVLASHHGDQNTCQEQLRGGKFVLSSGFQRFSPWLADYCYRPEMSQTIMAKGSAEGKLFTLRQPGSKEKVQKVPEGRCTLPEHARTRPPPPGMLNLPTFNHPVSTFKLGWDD